MAGAGSGVWIWGQERWDDFGIRASEYVYVYQRLQFVKQSWVHCKQLSHRFEASRSS